MNIRKNIERFFESWSTTVVDHRWLVLFLTLALSAAVIPQIRHGWVDISIESFLPHNDPAMVDYNDFRLTFNYAPGALLTVETEDGVFTMQNLNKIRALHDAAERQVPFLLKVTSLANVRYTRGEDDTMISGDLGEIWPETAADIPAFKEVVMSNPNYIGAVISANEKILNVLIEPLVFSPNNNNPNDAGFTYLQAQEETDYSQAVIDLAKQFTSAGFIVKNAGGPTMNLSISKDMEKSTGRSIGLGMLIIIVLLGLLFRRLSGVLLPLLVVALSLLMTLALWPTLGYPYNGNTQIIPTFLLAVGIADAIHILSIFYKHYDNGMDKHQAITQSIKETAIAVLLTTLTTAAGLLSFLASDMMPTRTMGIFGAIGVVMALFYTLALVPSLLAILPIKRHTVVKNKSTHEDQDEEAQEKPSLILKWVDSFIDTCADIGINHAKKVVWFSTALAALAVVGILNTQFSHDPLEWYPEGHDLITGIKQVDTLMDGSMSAYIILDTQEKNGLHDPNILKAIEDIEILIKDYQFKDIDAVEATSILSVIKETHRALNDNDPDFFVIPDNRQLIAQELLLFESGSDDIYDYSDFDLRLARINVQLKWSNVLFYREYVKNIHGLINDKLKEHGLGHIEVKVVGLLPIFGETLYSLLIGTVESYLIAFIFVFLIMLLLMESFRGGLLAFAPNMFPILITVGMIGLLGIPLNIITSTIGCIIIGISVDDTIHFMHHFRRYAEEYDDIKIVIHKTLHTCGRAIFFTSVVLVGGFIVHLSGELSTNKEFGWLLSFAIIIALIANLILAPALMMLFWHKNNKAVRA
ncbi:MAG: MMPL family transporter [Pseudomonadales bacterium]|nr:MMPL family transporter [Pseudomonadales bacterium]